MRLAKTIATNGFSKKAGNDFKLTSLTLKLFVLTISSDDSELIESEYSAESRRVSIATGADFFSSFLKKAASFTLRSKKYNKIHNLF